MRVSLRDRLFVYFLFGVCFAVNGDMDGQQQQHMDVTVAVIPKVENIFVHTGNIVNWSRLKGTVSKSATSEVI